MVQYRGAVYMNKLLGVVVGRSVIGYLLVLPSIKEVVESLALAQWHQGAE